eukprot:4801625-Pyramimonas_sp.AAC.1
MSAQLMAKIVPIPMKAVLGNSFMIRQLMAADFIAMTMDEDAPLVQTAFRGGRARATEAARLRDLHQKSPDHNPLPE